MTFNEFQRELAKKGVDPKTAYFFTLLFELFAAQQHQMDNTAKALLAMANTMQGFVQLNGEMEKKLQVVERFGRPDGIEVNSVLNEPEN